MTLASIPSPSISTFEIGPLTIHLYALCILAGIIAAVAITTARWKKVGGDFDQILDIAIVSVLAGIVGARVYHIVTTPERFFGPDGDPMEMIRIWNGGLGIWGGILFGALAAWGWCRHKHYPMALLADAVAPALLVAQAIGRLGNWFNQELYGGQTTLPWGNLIGAALIVWIGRRAAAVLKAGSLLTIYVMWYTAGRTWIEALRIDYAHTFLGVRINVWVSIAVFICGIIAFVAVQRIGSAPEPLQDRLAAVTASEQAGQGERTRHPASDEAPDASEPTEPESSASSEPSESSAETEHSDNVA